MGRYTYKPSMEKGQTKSQQQKLFTKNKEKMIK